MSKMTKAERDAYFADVDWAKTSVRQAANDTGMSYPGVYLRWKRSGSTTKPPKKHAWHTVDWSLKTSDIAAQLGIKSAGVSAARKKYAPETCQHRSPRKKKEVAV